MNEAPKNPTAQVDGYTGQALNYGAMMQQIAAMAIAHYGINEGDANAFGDPTTAADLAASLREIARVASAFAGRIEAA